MFNSMRRKMARTLGRMWLATPIGRARRDEAARRYLDHVRQLHEEHGIGQVDLPPFVAEYLRSRSAIS